MCGAGESANVILDTTCRAPTIEVERYAVVLRVAKWEIPAKTRAEDHEEDTFRCIGVGK